MEAKTNYFVVGLSVILLTLGLILTGLWLSVGFDQKEYVTYAVYMQEAVSGLTEDSPVKYNGVQVGYIERIALNPRDPQQVKLLVKIAKKTPITTSTEAKLISQGITGTTYLGLSAASDTMSPLKKKPGERYPVIPYRPSFFNQLERNIDELSTAIKRIFDEKNAKNIEKTLANLESITEVIEKNNKKLDESLKDLPILIRELKSSVIKFNQMSSDMSDAGKQVSDTMRAGRNSIDKISQQAIPPAVSFLNRLDLIAANLEKISAEMRQNPAILIRGTASPKLGPGER